MCVGRCEASNAASYGQSAPLSFLKRRGCSRVRSYAQLHMRTRARGAAACSNAAVQQACCLVPHVLFPRAPSTLQAEQSAAGCAEQVRSCCAPQLCVQMRVMRVCSHTSGSGANAGSHLVVVHPPSGCHNLGVPCARPAHARAASLRPPTAAGTHTHKHVVHTLRMPKSSASPSAVESIRRKGALDPRVAPCS